MLWFLSSVFETTIIEPSSLANHPRPPCQASNVMIKSSLLKTRLRLLQCYDIELTALICHTKRLPSEPLFSVGTGVQPISVNRQPCFCLVQWYDRKLTVFGMPHRAVLSEPLFSVGTAVQPLSVNRQPCLSVSLDCSQQLIQNCIWAWSFLNDLMIQHQILKALCVFKWSKCFNC